jgi:hypothetical protein
VQISSQSEERKGGQAMKGGGGEEEEKVGLWAPPVSESRLLRKVPFARPSSPQENRNHICHMLNLHPSGSPFFEVVKYLPSDMSAHNSHAKWRTNWFSFVLMV